METKTNPLSKAVVTVVGDAMVDDYVHGDVSRISPEAPVPVVKVARRHSVLGGAGNTMANLRALEASALFVSRTGKDDGARVFDELLKGFQVEQEFILRTSCPTTRKTRIIARNQQVVRVDEEEVSSLAQDEYEKFADFLKQARAQSDVVIVSDYAKGLINQNMFDLVCEIWRGGTVLVDPKPRFAITYKGATGITPNVAETRLLLGVDTLENTDEAISAAGQQLIEKLGLQYILITRSEAGMTLCRKGQACVHLPVAARDVYDVSGAGDTVIATFAAAIANDMDLVAAAELANAAAGVVVAKLGTATATWDELTAFMQEQKKQNQVA